MKKIFLVRHGLTKGNVDKIFTGQTETPLASEGKTQAVATGKEFATNGLSFDLIVTSPLSRAHQTAEYIAKQIGYPKEQIETNALFIERNFGVLEGTPVELFLGNHSPKQLDQVEGAETLAQMQKRAAKALDYLKTKKADSILVVSHGSFGRALRRQVQDLPHTHEYAADSFRIGNCEIIELV